MLRPGDPLHFSLLSVLRLADSCLPHVAVGAVLIVVAIVVDIVVETQCESIIRKQSNLGVSELALFTLSRDANIYEFKYQKFWNKIMLINYRLVSTIGKALL